MTGTNNYEQSFEPDGNDEIKTTQRDGEPEDDDEDEEEILFDTRRTLIEPSPTFYPHHYDTDRFHRHHRRESVLNPVGTIESTPVIQVLLITL